MVGDSGRQGACVPVPRTGCARARIAANLIGAAALLPASVPRHAAREPAQVPSPDCLMPRGMCSWVRPPPSRGVCLALRRVCSGVP